MKTVECKKYGFNYEEKKEIENALEIGIENDGDYYAGLEYYGERKREYEDIAAEIIDYVNKKHGLEINPTYTDVIVSDPELQDGVEFWLVEYEM